MKRLLPLLLSLLLLASCGTAPSESSPSGQAPQGEPTQTPPSQVQESSVLTDMETYATFGHVGLGLNIQVPDFHQYVTLRKLGSSVYPHGYSIYQNEIELFVELSLDGETDLEEIPFAIFREEKAVPADHGDEYFNGKYGFTEYTHTERVKLGEMDALYFEADAPKGVNEDYADPTWITLGYSFVYDGRGACVRAQYQPDVRDGLTKEQIRDVVQYIVLTLSPYNGEGFFDLQEENHIDEFYSYACGALTEHASMVREGAHGFSILGYETSTLSGTSQGTRGMGMYDRIGPKYNSYREELEYMELMDESVSYENVLQTVLADDEMRRELNLWSDDIATIEQESDLTLAGIPMKRYEVRISNERYPTTDFWVAYAFAIDGIPNVWKMSSDYVSLFDIPDDLREYEESLIRIQADTLIRTIQIDP